MVYLGSRDHIEFWIFVYANEVAIMVGPDAEINETQ